jgi:hypothetical protein
MSAPLDAIMRSTGSNLLLRYCKIVRTIMCFAIVYTTKIRGGCFRKRGKRLTILMVAVCTGELNSRYLPSSAEPKGLLQCSKVLAHGPYPKPDESSSYPIPL